MLGRRAYRPVLAWIKRDEGVSAVEFSLIAPVLLAMFAASIELPRIYAINQRLNTSAVTVADLISGGSFTDTSPVFAAVAAISNPYDVSRASIVVTAAGTYENGGATTTQVCSSAQSNGQARSVGSSVGTAPPGLTTNGSRFVMSEITMTYQPIFSFLTASADLTLSVRQVWPVRAGKIYNGEAEIVLPGGKPCPLHYGS